MNDISPITTCPNYWYLLKKEEKSSKVNKIKTEVKKALFTAPDTGVAFDLKLFLPKLITDYGTYDSIEFMN